MTVETFRLPSGGTLTYVPRSVWGGGPLRRGHLISLNRFLGLVLHETPLLPAAMKIERRPTGDITEAVRFMRRLQTVRPDLGSEVPYSWVILRGETDLDAIVCEGRGEGRTGAHTAGMNSKRYGVAIAQSAKDHPMELGQVEAFRWIGATSLTVANPAPATQHRDWAHVNSLNRTECASSADVLSLLQPPYDHRPAARAGGGSAGAGTPPSAPSTDPLPVLQLHDVGPAVREYQLLINVLLELLDRSQGREPRGRLQVTGTYDTATKDITEKFQAFAGISVDGVVGNLETRPALYRALATASASAVRREFGLSQIRPHPSAFGDLADPWRLQ